MKGAFNIADYMVWIWIGLAIFFMIIEALTVGLTTIWLACGAFIAMILALLRAGVWTQIIIFLIVSLILIGTTRKIFVNKLRTGSERTNTDAIIGQEGVVIERIAAHKPGRIKVNGQDWAALPKDGNQAMTAGETVIVSEISGVKLLVEKKEEK